MALVLHPVGFNIIPKHKLASTKALHQKHVEWHLLKPLSSACWQLCRQDWSQIASYLRCQGWGVEKEGQVPFKLNTHFPGCMSKELRHVQKTAGCVEWERQIDWRESELPFFHPLKEEDLSRPPWNLYPSRALPTITYPVSLSSQFYSLLFKP